MKIIGITGGSGSGKTTLVNQINELLNHLHIGIIAQDAYYHPTNHLSPSERSKINFDHPLAIDFQLLHQDLIKLKQGQPIYPPNYCYKSGTRTKGTLPISPQPVIILEGILIGNHPPIWDLLDYKVFVNLEEAERKQRIIDRDVKERGRNLNSTLQHFEQFVNPMHQIYIEPFRHKSNLIIEGNNFNHITFLTEIITNFHNQILDEKSI